MKLATKLELLPKKHDFLLIVRYLFRKIRQMPDTYNSNNLKIEIN